jgi:hydroxymethylpyrimidine pyrophosphatase-like HAD family hydrolase
MADIELVATDLDGTLIGSANDLPLYVDFRDRINEIRRRNNAVWVACTGRRHRSFHRFFSPMQSMGLMPDYVILRHAFIYKLTRHGYWPRMFWNIGISLHVAFNKLRAPSAIRNWHSLLTGGANHVTTVRRTRDQLCLRFDKEESAEVAAELLRDSVKPFPHLRVFKYLREVDVRSVPFTKGMALGELSRHLKIPASRVLAIGDGLNDISMLDERVAAMVGCPANAVPEVIALVHRRCGHISARESLGGVLDVMAAHERGPVSSALPENWRDPSEGFNPQARSRGRTRGPRHRPIDRQKVFLMVLSLYAVLVVFASFDLIPFVSGWLMKPYHLFLSLLARWSEGML